MGHISNPISNRLNFTTFWSSIWSSFLDKNYSYFLSEDFALEDFLFWFFFIKKRMHYIIMILWLIVFLFIEVLINFF